MILLSLTSEQNRLPCHNQRQLMRNTLTAEWLVNGLRVVSQWCWLRFGVKSARAHGTVRALDVVKLGKVMTSRMRASRDLQGTIDLQS